MSGREFGQLLTEGIRHICAREGKQTQVVEDELGYAVGRRGSSAIRYWRQGHRPPDSSIVEVLAREIVQRGRVGRSWLERFLRSGDYTDLRTLCNELFPHHRAQYLPTPPTALIGRDRDVSTVLARLTDDHVRLLTLTGAPGVGKTRLALQVAAEVRHTFADGLAFVQLSSIREPALLLMAVANTLGIIENDDQTLRARLLAFLQDRNLLLVLDNFEQVIVAAPGVAELLSGAPQVKVLVTSREPLHIYGEHEYGVQPLTLPTADEYAQLEVLAHVPAVQLFIERATAVNPDFQLNVENAAAIAAICTWLDGLPLAIELAAARSKRLSPSEILSQLNSRLTLLIGGPRDWPARQQTLYAAIEWSYELLTEREQRLFRRLGVFHGGCTLDAVEMICTPPEAAREHATAGNQLALLENLQDKNLLQSTHPHLTPDQLRYSMLETIREYAVYQLHLAGEAIETERRQRDWCLHLAEQAEQHLRGPEQMSWLNRLEQETLNIRAALSWCLAHPAEIEAGLRLVGALYWFWHLHSHFSEGREWVDKMLAIPIAPDAPLSTRRALAKVLSIASRLHGFEGNRTRAAAFSEASLTLALDIGEVDGIVFALTTPALMFGSTGPDQQRVVTLAEEMLPLCRAADDQFNVAQLLDNVLGPAAAAQGELVRAEALHEEALALRRSLGDIDGIAWSCFLLAALARTRGNEQRAQNLFEESRKLWQQIGNRRMYAAALNELGHLALRQEQYFQAQALFEENLAMHEGFGDRYRMALAQCALAAVACQQGKYEVTRSYLQTLATVVREIDRPWLVADYFSTAAELVYQTGATKEAVQLMSAAHAALDRLPRRTAVNTMPHEKLLTAARVELGSESFDQAWQEGRAMTVSTGITRTLAVIADTRSVNLN